VIIAESVEKPGNLGAILRTADAAQVDAILVCDPRVDAYSPNVVRASRGTIFTVPVVEAASTQALVFLQQRGIQVLATTPSAEVKYSDVNMRGPIAVAVGTEDEGLTDFWMSNADMKVHIPMMGRVNSLNVSVSTALILYEAVRQRNTALKEQRILCPAICTNNIHEIPNGPARGFTIIWLGQVVSLLGTAMTWFAFTIWAWEKTGKASALATISFFAFLPTVLLTPVAGAFVDRWNRKLVMLLSDSGTALGTLTVFLIYTFGDLQIWHIYVVSILAGFFTAFQYPAFAAAVTTMLSHQDYARASGMLGSARALSGILAPIFAAALLVPLGLSGIMLIDLATFTFAFGSLLLVHIPQPEPTATGLQSRGTLWQEILFGFRYIRESQSLWALTLLFMIAGIFLAIGATLMAPLVLSLTQHNESALAAVQSTGAVGGIVGGLILSIWGGAQRRIHNVRSVGPGHAFSGSCG
jgi:tRNA(Leu) C34 or U34 (ribose-2'-O)-methylase TrmL/MFS family permease